MASETAGDARDYKLREVLDFAVMAASKAGELVARTRMNQFRQRQGLASSDGDSKKQQSFGTKSNSCDVVTETDRAAEALIVRMIRERYPSFAIIGEEDASDKGSYELTGAPTFIVDPIDGTTNFLHGFPFTCVLISFADGGVVRAGVLRDPIHDETFTATLGGGCWLRSPGFNGRVQTSGQTDISKSYVFVDAGYGRDPVAVARFNSRTKHLLRRRVQGMRAAGSCGLCMAYVACGRIDGYFEELCPKLWDFAAGSLMVSEAGGWVGDPLGGPLDLKGTSVLAAGSKQLAEAILDAIAASERELKGNACAKGDTGASNTLHAPGGGTDNAAKAVGEKRRRVLSTDLAS